MSKEIERRQFLKNVTSSAVAVTAASLASQRAEAKPALPSIKDLPKHRLGRINIDVPMIGFGTAVIGHGYWKNHAAAKPVYDEVLNAALDAGMVYVDTAPNYDAAQPTLGSIISKRRKEIFLVSKVEAKSKDGALRQIDKTLEQLETDYLDLAHIHNAGEFTREQAIGKDSALAAIQEAQKRGLVKYIGASGHQRPLSFVPCIETGAIDLIMVAMNFVDRHNYNFEEKVLPAARKHDVAIVGMKVLGGVPNWGYRDFKPGAFVDKKYYELALRYVWSIPDLSMMVLGMKSLAELRDALSAARNYKPLTPKETEWLTAEGKKLCNERRDFLGPVDGVFAG